MEHYLPSVLLSLSPLKSCQWAVVVAQTVLEGGYPESIQWVSDVEVSIVTTKTTNKSAADRVVNKIGRGNAFESAAVDDS